MAAKRLLEDSANIPDKQDGKRVRRLPSFTMVIRKALAADCIKNLCLALEPLLRRVVQEEVERGLLRRACLLQRSPQMLIEEPKPCSALKLIFKEPPSLPIFTENRIEGDDGFPLQILIRETDTGAKPTTALPSSIKLEIVVLNGDFPYDDSENWSSSEFNRYVVKERRGKRPLLTGTTAVTLKDRVAAIDELKFTDNSSWTRSGKFRIGVRVSSEHHQILSIREAVSSPFKVKDHRGEINKKHYPPLLSDEVWRLEKIGKDGVYHKRLVEKNINTVQDFLKLSVIDSAQLKKILRMTDGKWKATVNHARTCPLGDKLYIHHAPHFSIVLNPICEVLNISVDGALQTFQGLSISMRAKVQDSVLEAYNCWDRLEVISFPSQAETHQNEYFLRWD
ncbi:protein SAR DEFICIENT 1-like [Phalaenopsis equestris]|uniref:protein SAR DEFICIENT 1-like n=1 Tax=Phalaenopsis equestris TaxID=78828 RepID=UPI0009E3B356|nr:protein SAR DEFICIENT 1-like [Phalaenopsis equestris]